jgi:hypothetical protein
MSTPTITLILTSLNDGVITNPQCGETLTFPISDNLTYRITALSSDVNVTYEWLLNGVSTSDANSIDFAIDTEGVSIYRITVTSTQDSTITATCSLVVVVINDVNGVTSSDPLSTEILHVIAYKGLTSTTSSNVTTYVDGDIITLSKLLCNTLVGNSAGGTPSYTYTWLTPNGSKFIGQIINANIAGKYILQTTDSSTPATNVITSVTVEIATPIVRTITSINGNIVDGTFIHNGCTLCVSSQLLIQHYPFDNVVVTIYVCNSMIGQQIIRLNTISSPSYGNYKFGILKANLCNLPSNGNLTLTVTTSDGLVVDTKTYAFTQ